MVPVEVSVNPTVRGTRPLVGLPLKPAAGVSAPIPLNALVLLPPLLLNKMTLLEAAALVGEKEISRLVEPNPGKAKGVPETMAKGPPLMLARPLLNGAPPRLVTSRVAWALEPTATMPKSRLAGETTRFAGVNPEPLTPLVELPPLLVKSTELVKLEAVAGAKLTDTSPV